MKRLSASLFAACLTLALGCGEAPEPESATSAPRELYEGPPPNIVLIVADDLGYGDLGSYGQEWIQTPELDELAEEGLRFSDFYAGSTVCAPSRAALMTGLHTGHTPVRGNREVKPMGQHPLPADTVTLADTLKDAGYTTALIGKWGLGGPGSTGEPTRQGFDYFFGYLGQRHAHNYYPEFLFRGTERVPLENVMPEPKREDGAGVASKKVEYSHDLLAAEALDFIAERAGEEEPFFLLLAVTIPHANNEAKQEGMEVPDLGPYADKDWPAPQKGHAAMITRLDSDVGELVDLIDSTGIAEETLILFTSDNGPHREGGNDPDFNDSNGPLRGIKRDLYEGGIRVPLVARWTGVTPEDETTGFVGAFWDFLPTFAELAGVEPPEGVDGVSMVPTLIGRASEQTEHEFLYWEFHEGGATKQAVRMGRWKAVRMAPDAPLELYDLWTDPGESDNVAEEHPEIVEKIEAYLETARSEHELWPLAGGAEP